MRGDPGGETQCRKAPAIAVILAVSRYAINLSLYSGFGGANQFDISVSGPYQPARAQVAELVDALASGASGFTAVKVRVLSWAPLAQCPEAVPSATVAGLARLSLARRWVEPEPCGRYRSVFWFPIQGFA
jgi:hypothetical protein